MRISVTVDVIHATSNLTEQMMLEDLLLLASAFGEFLILGPNLQERRHAADPSFAESFLENALASVKRLLKQNHNEWVILDPNLTRKQNVTLTRGRLVEMQKELGQ